jgi:GH25 family lysozyme M1 (1,4-beta-N-acetylmuramidase)
MKREYGKDFAADIKIDKYKLDEESEMSASILSHYAELNAEARTKVDRADNAVKLIMAKKMLEYSVNPMKDVKVTVDSLKAMVECDEEVQEAKEELLKATSKANNYYAAVDALHDKSARLHDLVDLWMKGYYTNT